MSDYDLKITTVKEVTDSILLELEKPKIEIVKPVRYPKPTQADYDRWEFEDEVRDASRGEY